MIIRHHHVFTHTLSDFNHTAVEAQTGELFGGHRAVGGWERARTAVAHSPLSIWWGSQDLSSS